ncbi:unnamed protein product [Rotaria sordida]|uniref:Reverse transcriptase domain-containing protein n=3 Tax=Rotaria sordida TaxID=392033 RepID=A0A815NRR6_9BILA|nr:unnamed protein product [Rotaria sordida]
MHLDGEHKHPYRLKHVQELAFEQLKWYKQTVNQPVTQYYDKIIELCKKVDAAISDSLKLKYLMAGIRESLKLHVALQHPKTTDAFLSLATKIDDTLLFTTTDNEININTITTQKSLEQTTISQKSQKIFDKIYVHKSNRNHVQIINVLRKVCIKKTQHYEPSRYSQYSQQSNCCYKCGTLGYYARDCTRTHFGRAILADGYTSLSVFGTMNLFIMMGDMSTSIKALFVKELCANCILEQIVSISDNYKRITLKFDINKGDIRYSARLINNVRIPPKRIVTVPVSVELSSAKVLFRPYFKLQQRLPIFMLNSSLTIHHHTSSISFHNPITYSCLLLKGIILRTTTIPTLSFKRNSIIDHRLVNNNITNLTRHIDNPEQRDRVETLLNQFAKLFDTSKLTIATNVKPHVIKTLDHPPPVSKPYYSTPSKQEEMYKIIQELLHFRLIRPSDSLYAAPALLVAKHNGTWRMVVDYKKLNNITIKDNHPLPNMKQATQLLGGGYKFFSKLDMKSGFCQIPIKEQAKFKTAFITPDGLFEWNVLAQSLKNTPLSFQRVMTDILSTCRQFSLVYIDDIVVYSRSFEEHLNHLTQVLSTLSKHNFQFNPIKYSIFHQQIDYLSHTISKHGVKSTNEKIQAIIKLRQPTKLAEANKFLGALSWHHFSDDNYPVILTTDASEIGIDDTLHQNINGEIKNLYYHSRITSSTQQRCDPIELEALAIWLCFQRM